MASVTLGAEPEGVLPEGWAWATLREIGTWYGGGTPSKQRPEFWENGTVPWISPKDMGADTLIATQDRISETAVTNSPVKLVPADSVAMVVRSGILERRTPIAWVPFETTLNQDMKAIRPHTGISARWLAWTLRAMENHILTKCRKRGTTVASLEIPWLMDVRIPVPPSEEQRRIVARLEEHMEHIEVGATAASAALKNASLLRQEISAQGAIGHLEPQDSMERMPLAEAGVDDGDLPALPTGWTWSRLGEIAEVVGGVTKDSKKQSDPGFIEVPYLRVANVQRGRLNLNEVSTIRVSPAKAAALKLHSGDVLLNEGGDRDKLGRGWIWEGQVTNCIHQNHVFRARVRNKIVHPKLLAWHANGFGKQWCDRNGSQMVNLASISLRKIKLLPVPIPPTELQGQLVADIEAHLEAATTAEGIAREAVAQSIELRSSLLTAAFSGSLVPRDPTDEPAAALLSRIASDRAAASVATPATRKRAVPRRPRTSPHPDQGELPQ